MRYHVELTAFVQAIRTITVEAINPEEAGKLAVAQAGANPPDWKIERLIYNHQLLPGVSLGPFPFCYRADNDDEWKEF